MFGIVVSIGGVSVFVCAGTQARAGRLPENQEQHIRGYLEGETPSSLQLFLPTLA